MPQHVTGAARRRVGYSLGGGLGGSIEGAAAPPGPTLRRPVLLLGALWSVLWAALALALVPAAAAQAGGERAPLPPADVPAAVRAPDGQVLLFRAFAQGTQVYECLPGGGAWTFRQPVATLVDDAGRDLGIHGRGPFWAAYDGSRVVGATQANAPARDPAQDVPLLLLRATANSGDGRFAAVNFIQRLDTRGGAAPAGPCDPAAGPVLEVPYHAVYYFYGDRAAA
jgi:hypothetical protein